MSTPSTFSDEILCAYLDGELQPGERAAVEQALLTDGALAERLERFRGVMQLMDQDLAGAASDAVPEVLLKAARDLADARPSPANVTQLRKPTKAAPLERWRLPIAAAIALTAGGVLGGAFQSWRDGMQFDQQVASLDAARISPANPLFAALERTASGETATVGDSRLRLILSFAAKDGRYCREFDAASQDAASVGIACRENGAWRLEVLLAAKPQDVGVYAPASGYNEQAFEGVVSVLMKDSPLDKAQERALIDRAWR